VRSRGGAYLALLVAALADEGLLLADGWAWEGGRHHLHGISIGLHEATTQGTVGVAPWLLHHLRRPVMREPPPASAAVAMGSALHLQASPPRNPPCQKPLPNRLWKKKRRGSQEE